MAIVALIVLTGLICSIIAAIYFLGPLIYARDQRSLMSTERAAIAEAAVETNGLGGVHLPHHPPTVGAAVGIIAIPAIGLNQAVIEGVGSSQTVAGPGHVPGTAGLGQRGSSVLVGRNNAFGGPFGQLDQLKPGEKILTATIEGQNTYVVHSVRILNFTAAVYRQKARNQLILITSASNSPFNSTVALEVTARMSGKPHVRTPQGSRSEQGNSSTFKDWLQLLLALCALAAAGAGAMYLYHRCVLRSAYLLSTAPLIACTVLAAESISRLLPSWM